ncbi:MAG: carboxylating nicotinate-nucleotide diphosphorylase [Nitrospirae bacterium]|nr:carboxylating nicotinate-nucleotide diphosphorylase [Nitrospirota bacterium]
MKNFILQPSSLPVRQAGFNLDLILMNALSEDIGHCDVTTSAVIPPGHKSKAVLIAKDEFILAGISFAGRVFSLLDAGIKFNADKKDGRRVKKGDVIARVSGSTADLLKAERTALNLLQRLSGIATLTHKFVECVKGLHVKITDTRKTAPNLRFFEKYAVRAGGGHNHRFGLFDGVLIKDNHIAAAGGITKAVRLARSKTHHIMKIEVEAKNIKEVKQALSAGADIIMLDNMPVKEMKNAVKVIRRQNPSILIEASGSVTLQNVRQIAETGVDMISSGTVTHSAPAVDISMKVLD